MPSATPFPRGPSLLTLYDAEDLLTSAGCPVCRYVAEVDDRFLAWFALEAHAEPGMITRLCESLGLCPRHSRGLLGQPGADSRLTVVYRHLLRAARAYLNAGKSPGRSCPACARCAAAADRALDTLLIGLREGQVRERYRDLGGLCVPHVRAAAALGGRRRAAWLAQTALSRLTARQCDLAVLAGDADLDAAVRARLRARLPGTASDASRRGQALGQGEPPRGRPSIGGVCAVCLAAAGAERDCLARVIDGPARGTQPAGHWRPLCAGHLRDAWADLHDGWPDARGVWPDMGDGGAAMSGISRRAEAAASLLALQREGSMAWLREIASPPGGWAAINPLALRRRGLRGAAGPPGCEVCQARAAAAVLAAERLRQALRTPPAARGSVDPLAPCLRHVLLLRKVDLRAGEVAVRAAAGRADLLVAELEQAFRKRTWAHRHEARGNEITAWRRAAAFADGAVSTAADHPGRCERRGRRAVLRAALAWAMCYACWMAALAHTLKSDRAAGVCCECVRMRHKPPGYPLSAPCACFSPPTCWRGRRS